MRAAILAAGLFVLCSSFLFGQDTKPKAKPSDTKPAETKPKPASRAEQFQSLRKDYAGPAEKLQEEIEEAKARLENLITKQEDAAAQYVGKLMELIKADPKDSVSLEAIDELLHEQSEALEEAQVTTLFETLSQHHAASEKVTAICMFAAEHELTDAIRSFLTAVIAKNKSPEAKSWAHFALAVDKYAKADEATDLKLFKEAELEFEKVVKVVPADETEGTPVEAAQQYLFELPHLLPGMKVPDFETEDLKGKPAKLSQFRGKVTLLLFWATWCEYCAELRPQQEELAKKYAGKPLAIVSVSGDDDVETVNEFLKKHPLPWTQWWNGPEGGVLDAWNVQAFPMVYLIDAKGIIRYRNIRDNELDKAVETLVKEAESPKADKPAESKK